MEYSDKYVYLGLLLTEHLDFNVTVKSVAQSASRALGLLIGRYKNMGGMSFTVFSKLYETTVWPVISYASAIWGTKSYSCINAVENRALRFFLGVGKYTPTAAVTGDTGWEPPLVKQCRNLCKFWHRLRNMDVNRIDKKVFIWAESNARSSCKNWVFSIKQIFTDLNLEIY